jgi:hypothetical protein
MPAAPQSVNAGLGEVGNVLVVVVVASVLVVVDSTVVLVVLTCTVLVVVAPSHACWQVWNWALQASF